MLKEFVEYILKLNKDTEFHTKNGELYTDKSLNKIHEPSRQALETY